MSNVVPLVAKDSSETREIPAEVRIVRPAKPAKRYVAELLVPFRFADKRVSRSKGGTVPGHFALTPVAPMPYRSASERGNEGTAPQLAE